MSGSAAYMDFEDPDYTPPAGGSAPKSGKRSQKSADGDGPKKEVAIPELPHRNIGPTSDDVRRGVSDRARSAANLKVEGYTYADIADMLEYDTPMDAKRAVESVLASLHGPEDYETLRMVAAARAEEQFKRSSAMAKATYLEDPASGEKFVNQDRIRWHQIAGSDLMNWASIVGAKVPAKLEISASDDQVERLVAEVLNRTGHEDIVEAEVIELDQIPDAASWDDPDDDDAS